MSEYMTKSYKDRSGCVKPKKTTWCCTKLSFGMQYMGRGGCKKGQTLTAGWSQDQMPSHSSTTTCQRSIHWKITSSHYQQQDYCDENPLFFVCLCTRETCVIQWKDTVTLECDRKNVEKPLLQRSSEDSAVAKTTQYQYRVARGGEFELGGMDDSVHCCCRLCRQRGAS